MSPSIYIIAGPNGAGKTTFAREFLPTYANCPTFINADLIAESMSPIAPGSVWFRAGRQMLDEIKMHVRQGDNFGFETTLSGLTYLRFLRGIKNRGYHLHLYYLWVPTVELALQRIGTRISKGGHAVPEMDVRRRYGRSIRNFLVHYRVLADSWILFDNSGLTPARIAFQKGGTFHIIEDDVFDAIVSTYSK